MKKKITRKQLRKVIQEEAVNASILHEQQMLLEFLPLLARAIPAVTRFVPAIGRAVGIGSKSAKALPAAAGAAGNVAKTGGIGSKMWGLAKGTATGVGAMSILGSLFGSDSEAKEVQQAMGSMGPAAQQLDQQGIQAIYGANNPDQMLAMSRNINANNLGDASVLYGAMKGLGTKEDIIRDVMMRRKDSIQQLAQEFAMFITNHPDENDVSLSSWLDGDGMTREAGIVEFLVSGKL